MKRFIVLFACILVSSGFARFSQQSAGGSTQPHFRTEGRPVASDQTTVRIGNIDRVVSVSPFALHPSRNLLDDSSLLPTRETAHVADPGYARDLIQNAGIRFTENRGQIVDSKGNLRPDVMCSAETGGVQIYFTSKGVSYVFEKPASVRKDDPWTASVLPTLAKQSDSEERQLYRMDMDLLLANPEPRIRFEEELPGYCNYYLPHCPQGITNVKSYGRIVYENVYPDIDLVFKSVNGRMKYEYVVRPGGKASDIRMKYSGAIDMDITNRGELEVRSPFGQIVEDSPFTFQNENDEVSSSYRLSGNVLSFELEQYDRSQVLVIDPWATYYGGGGEDSFNDIAIDGSGYIYVTGRTTSRYFPIQNALQTTYRGNMDAIAGMFNSSGTLLWMTFYGGTGQDNAMSCSVDDAGYMVFAGQTSSTNLPVQNAFQATSGGSSDAFVVKLNSSGARQWATYYGGNAQEWAGKITIEANGNSIITGTTYSTNFPTSPGCYQTMKDGSSGTSDAFLIKLNTTGLRVWGTYVGGNANDNGNGLDVDSNGIIILGMSAFSTNLPTTPGAVQTTNAGVSDLYLVKFTSSGQLTWATYFGGSDRDADTYFDTDMDADGSIFLTVATRSIDIPVSNAYQSTLAGGTDLFILKLSSSGAVVCATYFGGNEDETLYGSGLDPAGNLILTGFTRSTVFPTMNAHQPFNAGGMDAFVVKFGANGSPEWSTLLGGTGDEIGFAIACDASSNIFLAGRTGSSNFPMNNAWQSYYAGGMDACIASFTPAGVGPSLRYATITMSPNPTVVNQDNSTIYMGIGPQSVTLSAGNTSGFIVTSYLWNTGATTSSIIAAPGASTTYSVTVTDANGNVSACYFRVFVVDVRCGGGKVNYCQNGRTKCGSVSQALSACNNGAYLGTCITKGSEEGNSSITDDVFITNYPNPFNPSTILTYGLSEDADVRLLVFDVRGFLVRELVRARQAAGEHTVHFDESALPSGVYLYRLEANERMLTGTMTLVK